MLLLVPLLPRLLFAIGPWGEDCRYLLVAWGYNEAC
jgi:hypothetical protein